MNIEEKAKLAAGNWKKFDSFAWSRGYDLDDSKSWTIVYTHNRDSGLTDQSNAKTIADDLEQFTEADDPDVVPESHSHWACGWVDGFSIRVFRDGKITNAFRKYCELMNSLEDYPILDETDYSNREYDAAIENIGYAASSLENEYDLPKCWQSDVYTWLYDNDDGALENSDDQGGYPPEESIRTAFDALFPLEKY